MYARRKDNNQIQMSKAALATHRDTSAYARFISVGVLAVFVALVLTAAAFWRAPTVRLLLSGALMVTFAAFAAVACVIAWRCVPRPSNRIWLLFGVGAMSAVLSIFVVLLPQVEIRSTLIHVLWLSSYALLFAAVVFAIHETERGGLLDLALDVALIVAAASLVLSRWAPGTQAALETDSVATTFLIVLAPVVALSALLITAVLSTAKHSPLAPGALLGVAGAIGFMVISAVPQIMAGAPCCHADSPTTLAAIGMWALLGYGALQAFISRDQTFSTTGGQRLRQVVAPVVAIVLAGTSIEAALDPPLGSGTALALGVTGALVALRLTQLLTATRMQAFERRELAQTRALVEVSRALAGKTDLDTTLKTVTHWAMRVLNARAAVVELLSNDSSTLVLRAAEGLPNGAVGHTFPVEGSFTGWVILNGEPRVTPDARRDPYITPAGLEFVGSSPVAAVPLRYRERLLGVLSCIGTRPFEPDDIDLLRAFASQTALALEDARLFEQVRALSITDPLTGLANRRQLDRELFREFAAATRGRKLVVVMFDLDDFKQHNDKFGHVAGDEALKNFAESLRNATRTMNLAARYGGDEFIAILADSDLEGAQIFVSRVKEGFQTSMAAAGWQPLHVSAGIAEYTEDIKTPEDLIDAADRALYADKFDADVRA
jgi:diguanylate cyclase (GGDEF)-like protein